MVIVSNLLRVLGQFCGKIEFFHELKIDFLQLFGLFFYNEAIISQSIGAIELRFVSFWIVSKVLQNE